MAAQREQAPEAGEAIMACRSCGGPRPVPFLSLGPMPLTDAYVDPARVAEPEARYPLDAAFCPRCSLVQILHTAPLTAVFEEYSYYSSVSTTLLEHSYEHAAELIESRRLGRDSLVLEIASNDGYLLRHFAAAGVPVLGIDPARGPAAAAAAAGIPTICDFFGLDVAARMAADGVRADVILANNVLGHVPDLNGFVEGLALAVADDGVIEVEVPYLLQMVENLEFDTIYHEHLCYFSVTALDALFRRHGLSVKDVRALPIHGGSIRVSVGRGGSRAAAVRAYLERESAWGVDELETYRAFADEVATRRLELRALLEERRRAGRRIAAYGAAAKGTILLNACGVDARIVEFVADRSPHKQGKLLPGVRIPIRPPEAIATEMPDDVVMLAWNLQEEITAELDGYLDRGGRLLVPVPTPREIAGRGRSPMEMNNGRRGPAA